MDPEKGTDGQSELKLYFESGMRSSRQEGRNMIYDIQIKSDYLSGATLTIKIPEYELDKKALYTIQADSPKFLLPFHYRCIDDQVEFVYQIGAQSKLLYLSGSRSRGEYTALWSGVLSPLLTCGDWFMKPYSFVLSVEHLYYDRNENTVCYVYIPTIRDCSQHAAIREMAAEFSKHISVDDADLENMVLRAIMRDFNPKDLLRMLEQYNNVSNTSMTLWSAPRPASSYPASSYPAPSFPAESAGLSRQEAPCPDFERIKKHENRSRASGDILITIPSKGRRHKKEKGTQAEWKDTDRDMIKEQKRQKSARGLFSGRKDLLQDAAAGPVYTHPKPMLEPVYIAEVDFAPQTDTFDITQSVPATMSGARFRLVGSVLLPTIIDVQISDGDIFTIGRFDAVIGKQQSSFEFDKKTKAISRRHAAIERNAGKHSIIDLSSSAGTYLNGMKLPPNTPCELGNGCRVSFGNAGADYVWEE